MTTTVPSSRAPDATPAGAVAQFGRGIMGDVSSKLMAQFADNLNEMIDEQEVVTSADAETAKPTDAAPATSAEADSKPQVRRIEGPATEPIDLMEVGGSSLVKRVVPALVAIVIVLLLLRRRRG
jgi:hypothetical protein